MEFTPKMKKHVLALERQYRQENPWSADSFCSARSCPVIGIDLHGELCYSVTCRHDEDGTVYAEEAAAPLPIALRGLDFDTCQIGQEAVRQADQPGEGPLYRDFLQVPDERAKACYGGVPGGPSYEKLMGLFFRSLFFERGTGKDIFLVSLPEGPEWEGQEAAFTAFLNRQCAQLDYWHAQFARSSGEEPDPLEHSFVLVIPRQQVPAIERFTRKEDETGDAFAAARGLARAGYLLWYRELLQLQIDGMLQAARPHVEERLRDALCDRLGQMLFERLELRLKAWTESGYAARSALDVLWSKPCGVRLSDARELFYPIRDLLLSSLPVTGRDPTEDPGAIVGVMPATYLGPRIVYGSENLLHALTDLINEQFCSRLLPWTKGQYYAEDRDWVQTEPEVLQPVLQPFYTAAQLSAKQGDPSPAALFGSWNALTLAAKLHDTKALPETRQQICQLFLSRKEKICRVLSLKIYHNTAGWNALADRLFEQMAANLRRDLDMRLAFLGHTAPTPHPEEGLLE